MLSITAGVGGAGMEAQEHVMEKNKNVTVFMYIYIYITVYMDIIIRYVWSV